MTALITRPYTFDMMDGKCQNCRKKLPKSKAYWCSVRCFGRFQDKAFKAWLKTDGNPNKQSSETK